jgi:hypothetical protein
MPQRLEETIGVGGDAGRGIIVNGSPCKLPDAVEGGARQLPLAEAVTLTIAPFTKAVVEKLPVLPVFAVARVLLLPSSNVH